MARLNRPSQFSDAALPFTDAVSLCGPVAALAFLDQNDRTPSFAEARDLAKEVGWTPDGGMNGVANEKRLLDLMDQRYGTKFNAQLDTAPSWDGIAQTVKNGQPMILSTSRHYFTLDQYDPLSGRFHVGTSGTDMRGGSDWLTADQIASLGQGVNGALTLNVTHPTATPDAGSRSAPEPPIPSSQPAPPRTTEAARGDPLAGLPERVEEPSYAHSAYPDALAVEDSSPAPAAPTPAKAPPQPTASDYLSMLRQVAPSFGSTPALAVDTQPVYALPTRPRAGYGLPSLGEMAGMA